MTTSRTKVMVALAAVAVAGCTSTKSYPNSNLRYQIFPQAAAKSETELRRVMDRRVRLPSQVSVGIAWLNQRSADFDALPDGERGRLLKRFADGLREPPIADAVVLPTVANFAARGEGGDELDNLRSNAAHFQSDVLVILSTSTNEYVDWNAIALSYLAILPAYFFPGDDLFVYANAEACAVDVRTGIFLGCATGQSEQQLGFVTGIRRDVRMRELTVAALEDALDGMPRDLRNGIYKHSGERDSATRSLGSAPGREYRTVP